MDHTTVVFVLARSGSFRGALVSLLTTIPAIHTLVVTGGNLEQQPWLKELHPRVALLEYNPAHGQTPSPAVVRGLFPEAHWVVLLEGSQVADIPGADEVFLQGRPPGELVAVVERLLKS